MNLNNPELWIPKDLPHALTLVGGPDAEQLNEEEGVSDVLAGLIEEGSVCVDFGCGYGRILKPLTQKVEATFIGVDFNSKMLDMARTYAENASYELIDGHSLPFDDQSIDFIFSHAVLIHNDHVALNWIFEEFARVLRGTGRMYHDFHHNEKASEHALALDFPLYAHEESFIRQIAEIYGFDLHEMHEGDDRSSYMFKVI